MKIKDLRSQLVEILEVPEQSSQVGREILFGKLCSPRMLDLLTLGTALECILDEFEETWEGVGRSPRAEVSLEALEILISITNSFFSYIIEANPLDSWIINEAKKEERTILEAIEVLKKKLFP